MSDLQIETNDLKHCSNSDEEYEDEEDSVTIQFNSETIQIKYSQLCKYSKRIRDKYIISDVQNNLSQELQQLLHESDINEESIISLFQYFKNGKLMITNNNYRDFYKLSEFFQSKTLFRYLEKYAISHNENVEFIIEVILKELSTQKDKDNIDFKLNCNMEQKLINHINECLQTNNFSKLPIPMIFNIFSAAKGYKISSDLLYDFIKQSKEKFFVLFTFLDLQTLSSERFDDLYNDYLNSSNGSSSKYFQFLQCNLEYIKVLKEKNEIMKKQLEKADLDYKDELGKLNDANKKLNKIILQKVDENNKLKKIVSQKEEENKNDKDELLKLKEENEKLKSDIEATNKKCDEILINFNKGSDFFFRGINSYFRNPSNKKEALYYFELSSKKGNSYGSYLAGICNEKGEGDKVNIKKAIEYFEKMTEQGNSYGLNKIGMLYEDGKEIEQDYSKAIKYYEQSASHGNSYGINSLGYCFEYGKGVEKNISKAIEYYNQSALLENPLALNNLGLCYDYGKGVEKNFSKAIEYYERSASHGNSYALRNLGICYENGNGIEKNISKAFEYYEQSASLGNASGLNSLGLCYEYGKGVEINMSKAFDYYNQSSSLGNSYALNNLGLCYEYGKGIEKNMSKAIEYYERSSSLENSIAIYNLGLCYEYGTGVEKNIQKAIELYERAASLGHSDSKNRLMALQK